LRHNLIGRQQWQGHVSPADDGYVFVIGIIAGKAILCRKKEDTEKY